MLVKFIVAVRRFGEKVSSRWKGFWCYVDGVEDGDRILENGKCKGFIQLFSKTLIDEDCERCKYYVGNCKKGEGDGKREA